MAVIKFPEANLQSLIDGCVLLERESQRRFYESFYGYALAVCHRYIHTQDDALEVMNDGFFKIFKEVHRFEPRVNLESSLKAWMRRIFVNTAIDHLRKYKHQYIFSANDEMEDLAVAKTETPESGFSHRELLEMIAKLSPAYQLVFNLFVIDGFSHEEIGKMLNIAPGTSKSNLAKARMNLQKMIRTQEGKLTDYERKAI